MTKRILAGLGALFVLFFVAAFAVSAQAPVSPQVISTVAHPGAEGLGLDVYFVVTDGDGQPVLDANLEEATIQVVGSASAPIPATISTPQSTIYVVLLLDVSGSMQNIIGQVRAAALSALQTLPANARVSVIAFSDQISVVTDFTGDFITVQQRIQQISVAPGAPTCLYDAVWDVIDRLDIAATEPQDRRALILFTDGRDEKGNGQACSIHTLQDVVQKAQRQPATPIHTIGLCGATCANLNVTELSEIASATRGFAVTGGQTDLEDMFQAIMDGLNAQLVARAVVYPRQGTGQAVLAVRPHDLNAFVTTMFNFRSDKDYAEPLPPVAVRVTELTFLPDNNTYQVGLGVGNPQSADRLIVSIEETEGGKTVLKGLEINVEGRAALQTDLPAANLTAGRKYTIKFQAVDVANNFLTLPEGADACSDDPTVLGCKEFTHEPPVAPGCEFAVQSVASDYTNQVLRFDLVMPKQCNDVFYQGVIVQKDTGQKVQDIARGTFFAAQGTNQINIPMPVRLLQLKKKDPVPELAMTLTLETRESKQTTLAYEFVPDRRPPVPLTEFLRRNIMFLVGGLAIVVLYFLYHTWQSQQAEKQKREQVRPPIESTTKPVKFETPAMRLKLHILSTPDPQNRRDLVVSQFPFVIGRKEGNLIIRDQKVSGKHAQITINGNEFFIEDLGSTNHTYLAGKPLVPHSPQRLPSKLKVRLGPDTEIEIETI